MREVQHNSASRLAPVLVCGLISALAVALSAARQAAAQEPPADAVPVQYARVGVVPLRDEGNIRDGADKLSEMLAGRLSGRFDEVEFVLIKRDEDGDNEPLLLDEAVKLGKEQGVDALLDGVFQGIEIVGGTWPNQGSDLPMARGMMRWRLVDCSTGLLALDGKVAPRKPKCYPMRIRTEEELISSVMQDMVAEVGTGLEEAGILAGTEPPADEQESEVAETPEP